MAATDITIYQDNIVGDCNLLACHSPLVFLIDQTYTGLPNNVYCDIFAGTGDPVGDPLDTFLCAFDSEQSTTVRRYRFIADSILRGFMDDFDDFVQSAESVQIVQKVQMDFVLRFYSSNEIGTYEDSVQIVAFAASQQFGQSPAITNIYDNEDILYLAGSNKPVYIYFFNDNAGAIAKIVKGVTEYSLGSEVELLDEEFDSWSGTGWATYPTDWTLWTNPAPSEFWRVYESVAGISKWILNGNPSKYIVMYNDNVAWDKGEEVWCEITYKGGGAGAQFLNNALPAGGFGYLGGGRVLPYAYDWTTVEYKFLDYLSTPGDRWPLVGFFKLTGIDYSIEISRMIIYKKASNIGYYRLKVQNLTTDTDFILYHGATPVVTKTVRVTEFCTESKLLKYIDRSGRYRFVTFNQFWEMKDNPQLLGKTNKLLTSILTDQTDARVIGYRNERRLTLVSDEVAADELLIISEIYSSPRVYLYIGTTGDTAQDWLEVTIEPAEKTVRNKKGNYSTVTIEVILPEQYNISML